MFKRQLFTVFAIALIAGNAQPPVITPCVLQCLMGASDGAKCTGYQDIHCVCSSATFQNMSTSCAQANCNPQEQKSIQQVWQMECDPSSIPSSSRSLTPIPTSPASPNEPSAVSSPSGDGQPDQMSTIIAGASLALLFIFVVAAALYWRRRYRKRVIWLAQPQLARGYPSTT